MSEYEELTVGDWVEATWTTPSGKTKQQRAKVIGLRPKQARIEYVRSSRCSWKLVKSYDFTGKAGVVKSQPRFSI